MIGTSLDCEELEISNTVEALLPSLWVIMVQNDVFVLEHFIALRDLNV